MNRFLWVLLLLIGTNSYGNRYWVYLAEREPGIGTVSQSTIENRIRFGLEVQQETDRFPNQVLVKQVAGCGATIRFQSKWLGAVSIEASPSQVLAIAELPGVIGIEAFHGTFLPTAYNNADTKLALAQEQMGTSTFIQKGLTGKGIKTGLIDAGFREADLSSQLSHLFSGGAVKKVRDFVLPSHTPRFFRGPSDSLDTHGATVLKMVAGYDSSKSTYLGCATGVELYLARTDDAKHEYRAEEDQWLAAMEWMDSLGVRLINSSLGYAKGFDLETDNYVPKQMNGKTTAVSKATKIATNKKGIMVVISAGNDGADPDWGIISSPADAEGVLSVGATVGKPYKKASYSGVGPDWLSYIKPDVAAYSLTGTSFSAPAVAGFVACLMEAKPDLSNKDLMDLMHKSSTLYPYPNNYLGYGIPDAAKALSGEAILGKKIKVKREEVYKMPLPNVESIVAFHQQKLKFVTSQVEIKVTNNELLVQNTDASIKYTTLMLPTEVVLIEWN